MSEQELFHVYVVGGARATARAHITKLLTPFKVLTPGNPDYIVTEHVTFTIENARTLRSWQELASVAGGKKVYVAYADFITREAENALLKTFEEPSINTHIFLAVPKPEILLPTLLSRVRIIMPKEREGNEIDAKNFLSLSLAERLSYVGKLVEKSDDDDAAAEVRERTLALIDSLEEYLARDPAMNAQTLGEILHCKKYLYISGASSRILLETLALTI